MVGESERHRLSEDYNLAPNHEYAVNSSTCIRGAVLSILRYASTAHFLSGRHKMAHSLRHEHGICIEKLGREEDGTQIEVEIDELGTLLLHLV